MKQLIIFTVGLFLFHFSQAQDSWVTKKYDNTSISHPITWDWDQSGNLNTKFIIFSPSENKNDNFLENVNLIMQDVSLYKLSFDQYIEISEKTIPNLITNGKILKSERISKDGNIFHHLVYTGKQGILDLRFEQYIWLIDNTAYVLTFTSEIKSYEKFQLSANKILKSFQLN